MDTHKIEFSQKSIHSFELMGERQFLLKTFRFKDFRRYFEVCVYDDETGEGEQRAQTEAHVKKIRDAIMDNEYTPTTFTVAVPSDTIQDGAIVFSKLPLIDGGHRLAALLKIYEKEQGLREAIDRLPMPTMLLIDSDTKKDFVNLQKGRPADPTQILSMNIRSSSFKSDEQKQYEFARDVARLLNTKKGSPFFGYIKFDTKSASKGVKGAAIIKKDNSVLTLGGAYSLCQKYKLSPEQYVDYAVSAYSSFKHTQAFEKGNFLHGEGTNCPFSMLIALMNVGALAKSAKITPNWEYGLAVLAIPKESRSFSSNRRQSLLYDVCYNLFEDVNCEKEQDIPKVLIDVFGYKSFNLKKEKEGAIEFDSFLEEEDAAVC